MMMWKPSSKRRKINRLGVSMETHKIDKLKDEPHLSSAYIRTLVKHLTTSIKTKHGHHPQSMNSDTMQQQSPPPPSPPPQPPHRKQVRRRRHTTKPYQERLLNMAEARREIVTALKFHRASMKQRETAANHPQPEQSSSTTVTPHYWPISTASPPPLPLPLPPLSYENLEFTLPNRTLGLNLNFQDFKNLDTSLYQKPVSNYPTSSSSSTSSFSSSSSTGMSGEVVAASTTSTSTTTSSSSSSSGGGVMNGGLHHAMDDEEMEEMRSLGEQHQMEWNDTVNLLTSARWFQFLNTIEIEQEGGKLDDEINPFDQVMEFPPSINIGEIEELDGEWLA